jgi:hypothetical protein
VSPVDKLLGARQDESVTRLIEHLDGQDLSAFSDNTLIDIGIYVEQVPLKGPIIAIIDRQFRGLKKHLDRSDVYISVDEFAERAVEQGGKNLDGALLLPLLVNCGCRAIR